MKEIYFLNNHNYKEVTFGPSQVFNYFTKDMEKNYGVKVISPETGYSSVGKMLRPILKSIFFKKEANTYVVNGEGLKLTLIMFILSMAFRKHRFFLLYHGLRVVEDKITSTSNKNYYIAEKIILKHFPRVICVSNFLKNLIIENTGRQKGIDVIYNGISKDQISTNMKDKDSINDSTKVIKLIMPGGIKSIKGIGEAVNFVEYANNLSLNFKVELNIFGGCDEMDESKLLLSSIESNKHMNYYGVADKERLYSEYVRNDFCIALSKFDTFNMTLLESMAKGTPVICSTNVGASEIIQKGKHGFILEGQNYGALVEFLRDVVGKPGLYNEMTKECIALAQRYTWMDIQKQYMNLITQNPMVML